MGLKHATIVIDVRERDLSAAFEAHDVPFQRAQLDIGDVEIHVGDVKRMVVERKTMMDLAASVKDGRYREQKERLMATSSSGSKIVYVLEGGPAILFDGRMRSIGGLSPATIQGCFLSMSLKDGIRAVCTADVADTAAFIMRAAEWLSKKPLVSSSPVTTDSSSSHHGYDTYKNAACMSATVSCRKRDNVDGATCFRHMLCQIPGVSTKLSGILCEAFGSMRKLYARMAPMHSTERLAALASIPMIGKAMARKLEHYLFDDGASAVKDKEGEGVVNDGEQNTYSNAE